MPNDSRGFEATPATPTCVRLGEVIKRIFPDGADPLERLCADLLATPYGKED